MLSGAKSVNSSVKGEMADLYTQVVRDEDYTHKCK